MKGILLDSAGRFRNGVWMLLFVALFLLSRALYKPVADALRLLGATDSWLEPLGVVFLLGVTWACLRLRRETLGDVGLRLDRRWIAESLSGLGLGVASGLAALALMWSADGVQLQLDPQRSASAVLSGLYLFACVALLEELLFRGFLFQRLVAGVGFPSAQIAMALLFALAHWGNPDMQGEARWIASIEIGLGAVLLGLAWQRTRSLALPFGLHLGWNWMQGHVLGFDVSGLDQPGWFMPLLGDAPTWLTGGAFGLEASVCAIAVDLVLIVALWRWKGRRASSPAGVPAQVASTPSRPVARRGAR